MFTRWIPLALMSLGVFSASCTPGLVTAPPRSVVAGVPDVAARNLPPEQEIDALLAGLPGLGKAGGVSRVVVAPFAVPGDAGLAWIGEAASEVVAERVSAAAGVSVLGRDEIGRITTEIARAAETDADAAVATLGRSVGAAFVVYGKAAPAGGDHLDLAVRAVNVATGEGRRVAGGVLARSDVAGTMGPVAASVAGAFGVEGGPPAAPLDSAKLEMATRAQKLQGEGKLFEALPLYEQALAAPSSAWRLETAYLRLLFDLGLDHEPGDRARAVLARIPVGAETVCARARLMLEEVRDRWEVGETREAVRTAASCGDDTVTALALRHHAGAVENVHYPTGRAALERSHALFAKGPPAWGACWTEFHRYIRLAENGDWQGRRDTHLLPIAEACEVAGNTRMEAFALRLAGDWTPQAKLRLGHYEKAVAALPEGSMADTVLRSLTGELRRLGRTTQAEEKLLAALGARVEALSALHGGLPAPLDRLDPDLLRRAHAGTTKAAAAQPKDPLLALALRKSIATLLDVWAGWTRSDSTRRADAEKRLAEELDPPVHPAPPGETADAALDRKLAQAKLPLSQIAAATEAPLRGSGADVFSAYWALSSWISDDRRRNDEKHARVFEAMRKVARWVDQPRVQRDLLMEEARRLNIDGKRAEALARARETMTFTPGDPDWADDELAFEAAVLKPTDPASMMEVATRRAEAARKVSGAAWVRALDRMTYDAYDTHQGTAEEGVRRLTEACAELHRAGDFESAAEALRVAGKLLSMGKQRSGSEEEVAMMRRRVPLLDELGDPARSLEARIEVLDAIRLHFSEGFPRRAREYVANDDIVLELMPDVRRRLDELGAAGREREAARLVARIPVGAKGLPELLRAALGWSERFKDGADYPLIAARLWSLEAELETDRAPRMAALRTALGFFAKADAVPEAVAAARRLIKDAATEADLWTALDACIEVARTDPTQPDYCVDGVMNTIADFGPDRLKDLGRIRSVFEQGRAMLEGADTGNPKYRASYRAKLSEMAALAGDWDAMEKLDSEVRAYLDQNPSYSYPYSQHVARLASFSAPRDPRRAVAFARKFDDLHAAAPVWIATQFLEFADFARRAGDAQALAYFEAEGRRAAHTSNVEWLPYYELNLVKDAVRRKDWRAAAKGYLAAVETMKKDVPTDQYGPGEHRASAAEALLFARDTAAANRLLDPLVAGTERTLKAGQRLERPCFDAGVLSLAAASRMAAGQCAEGDRLRALASRVKASCKAEVCYPTSPDGQWCDGQHRLAGREIANACRTPVPVDPESLPHAR